VKTMVGDEEVAQRMNRMFCLAAHYPPSADHQAEASARAKLVSILRRRTYRLHGPPAGHTCELITFGIACL